MESFDVGKGREHHAPAMPMNMHFYSVRRKNINGGRYMQTSNELAIQGIWSFTIRVSDPKNMPTTNNNKRNRMSSMTTMAGPVLTLAFLSFSLPLRGFNRILGKLMMDGVSQSNQINPKRYDHNVDCINSIQSTQQRILSFSALASSSPRRLYTTHTTHHRRLLSFYHHVLLLLA
jgi:hypothetical protein